MIRIATFMSPRPYDMNVAIRTLMFTTIATVLW